MKVSEIGINVVTMDVLYSFTFRKFNLVSILLDSAVEEFNERIG